MKTAMSVVVLLLGLALTDRVCGFAGGTGEPNDPYQVATVEDLLAIGSSDELLSKRFVLVDDLDLDPNLPGGRVFEDALIAQDESEDIGGHGGNPFSGVLDGRGHTIRNLCISGRYGYDAGLIGKLSGLVKDLKLQDVRISGSPCGAIAGLNHQGMILRCSITGQISGSEDVGGMVGSLWDATLMDCRAEAQVTGEKDVGGLVGGGPGGMLIRCTAQVDVRGETNVGGLAGGPQSCQLIESGAGGTIVGVDNVGGLTGVLNRTGTIRRCAVDGEIVAEQTAGGLAGNVLFGQGAWIMDSSVRGSVAGSPAGGLLGVTWDTRILNCYAACRMIPMTPPAETAPAPLGGLFGEVNEHRPPLVIASFWDAELSGVSRSVGTGSQHLGTGLATEQMQQQATFEGAGWDFASTWVMPEGGYPVLQWEQTSEAEQTPDAGR